LTQKQRNEFTTMTIKEFSAHLKYAIKRGQLSLGVFGNRRAFLMMLALSDWGSPFLIGLYYIIELNSV
jgi:hypothetical protein